MNHRVAGLIAMLAAPCLWIDFSVNGSPAHSPVSMGVLGLLYMSGWMISVASLYRLQAAGKSRLSRGILLTQLLFLSLAQVWNVLVILQVDQTSSLFAVTDKFWPLSNVFMLVTGIATLAGGRLQGWKRWVPLLVGLWFPLSVLSGLAPGAGEIGTLFSGLYSTVTFALLGLVILTTPPARHQTTTTFPELQTA